MRPILLGVLAAALLVMNSAVAHGGRSGRKVSSLLWCRQLPC